jgi:predicted aspartyl protease
LPEIIGHVDLRNRPLVSISIPNYEDNILALVDTGFNGYLLVHQDNARHLGFSLPGVEITVELAGHAMRRFRVADGRVLWFGQVREVPVLLSTEDYSLVAPDEPVLLIGTALLNPNKLIVDFTNRSVVIAQSD